MRGRAALGSELVWPRYDDHFDALYAFLELERRYYRVRAGRQQRASGLGFYAFDGLTATARPWATGSGTTASSAPWRACDSNETTTGILRSNDCQ